MATDLPLLIALEDTARCSETSVGGKAAKLSRLAAAGFRVPLGFCLTVRAHEVFVRENGIEDAIRMELGRKPLEGMRWEEMWDSALRIRSLFLQRPLDGELRRQIGEALSDLAPSGSLVVRSSALGEDSEGRSFAGLHESFTGVRGEEAVADAVRLVWASLWSDAALLYRKELDLDPAASRMAVLVQEMVDADRSGVAFARDPRTGRDDRSVLEAVPGPCRLLVDGLVDPDRWEIERSSRRVLRWLPGDRGEPSESEPLLEPLEVDSVVGALFDVEALFGWPPDLEWTGRSDSLTVLQARPITTGSPGDDDGREWYLTLRPGDERLRALRVRVAEELIPRLEAEGERFAAQDLDGLDDDALAHALEERRGALEGWERIYWDEFIPFAHGVRRLATYYHDAVRPEDPYEFIGLLQDQDMLAARRNRMLGALAAALADDEDLRSAVARAVGERPGEFDWARERRELERVAGAAAWIADFERLTEEHLDVAYSGERLRDGVRSFLRNVLELSGRERAPEVRVHASDVATLEERLLAAVGPERVSEAREVIETARLSWRLRDDDNLLVGRVESQLLRAVHEADRRLRESRRLSGDRRPGVEATGPLVDLLRDPELRLTLRKKREPGGRESGDPSAPGERPRQLIGQPAGPGMATGRVRRVRGAEDLGEFRAGEVLVCDAIQPGITHLVPLACAIVERRGGMLIHGAIIARELGIPCVNGVRDAARLLEDGEIVTVDGHLGIVTVGPPEFDLELGAGELPGRGSSDTRED